ncbi:MAG TPA: type II toxin-antitoxin system death-on-curing family toxin [Gammaproteobacteria bacterium]|nr:type II toxin-antitoxin system death-on-curing family toxin [Gammaproteobacteria bacterium]
MNEPAWLDARDVIFLHERLIGLYGGPGGLRDRGLLESALGRAQQLRAYDERADIIDLAAASTAGIVLNHPFVDGNKRTGFLVGVLFLELNGFRFTADEAAATRAVIELAAGTLDAVGYAAFLRANATRE